jgi:hypothetical protein
VDLGGSLKILGAGIGWRRLGLAGSGRRLLEAVGGEHEQERMLAGIALVRAGDRSVDLIDSAIKEGCGSPQAIRLLADIGSQRARSVLVSVAASAEPLESAAKEALDLLDRIDQLGDEA